MTQNIGGKSSSQKQAWKISCSAFTALVVTDCRGVIVEAAPIIRRFIGQYRSRLKGWAERKYGEVRIHKLES